MWFRRHRQDSSALREAREATDASMAQAMEARDRELAEVTRDVALAGRLRQMREQNHFAALLGAAFGEGRNEPGPARH